PHLALLSFPPRRSSDLTARGARWDLRLEPGVREVLQWEVRAGRPSSGPPAAIDLRRVAIAEHYDSWRQACTRWRTDVAEFNTTLDRKSTRLNSSHVKIS